MTRRRVVLSLLATAGSAAAVLAPMAHAEGTNPVKPCPVTPIVRVNDGSVTVTLPASTNGNCFTSITVPLPARAEALPSRPIACPVQPLVYESNGTDYLSIPDPTGKQCRDNIPLPGVVPPSA